MASRPSVASSYGVPMVMPSTSVLKIWSTPSLTPAISSRSVRRTPIQRAPPTYGPPTLFETQVSVMSRSISGMSSRSWKLKVTFLSTIPSMVRLQRVDVDDRDVEAGVHAVEVGAGDAERR